MASTTVGYATESASVLLTFPELAEIGEEDPKIVEFEPIPETAPVETPSETPAPAEPVPA